MMAVKTILVTRPAAQGDILCKKLRDSGFTAINVPVMEVKPLDSAEQQAHIEKIFSRITSYHGIVFVSVNAAECALPWLKKFPHARTTRLFSVGKTTALYYNDNHVHDSRVIYPRVDMNSEGLLALPEMQADTVKGKRFLILRGSGGRELLAQTLRDRGAHVDSCELYRRCLPGQNASALNQALSDADVLVVNSAESLENLLTLVEAGHQETMLDKVLLVPGERVASVGRQMNFRHIITMPNATDDAVIETLAHWAAS